MRNYSSHLYHGNVYNYWWEHYRMAGTQLTHEIYGWYLDSRERVHSYIMNRLLSHTYIIFTILSTYIYIYICVCVCVCVCGCIFSKYTYMKTWWLGPTRFVFAWFYLICGDINVLNFRPKYPQTHASAAFPFHQLLVGHGTDNGDQPTLVPGPAVAVVYFHIWRPWHAPEHTHHTSPRPSHPQEV